MTTIPCQQALPASPGRKSHRVPSTGRSCLDCVFHSETVVLDGSIHLCILPPDCAPPVERDNEDEEWRDHECEGRTYLGTSCDVMRRMGAACGPHAAMWLDAHASSAVCTPQGDHA